MSKPWILVSPASRGIGHALTRHLLRTTTAPILATARTDLPGVRASILDSLFPSSSPSPPHPSSSSHSSSPTPSTATQHLDEQETASAAAAAAQRLHVTHLDVEREHTAEAAAAEARRLFPPATHHLRLAFALPGVLRPEKSPRDVDYDAALRALRVNVLGPMVLMKWFGDFLPRRRPARGMTAEMGFADSVFCSPPSSSFGSADGSGQGGGGETHATWLTASARVGSTSDNRLGGWYTYRASKAAVNSLTKTFDLHLQARSGGGGGAIAVAYHPGTVKTDLSREFWGHVPTDKLFSPEYAAERMVEVVRSRTLADRGRCWDWKGEEVMP
ncbi:NAD(P)-binding protein [Hypoxylon rubiginosum]|uniref:NAD(P)-binding protein n=1 Tax=Hypoxylon rubiginosum TaxID=110542 RepID=A0ACB9Z4C0_9PEZI|nr:NAD(P)-binding protein [Hypoxylon rubiginosum]